MTAAHVLLAAAETEERIEIGASPLVWGISAFAILMFLLLGTLAFGKGRS